MNYIKLIRQAFCLKQSELGEFLNISRSYVSMLEIDRRRPDIEQKQRLECLFRFHNHAHNAPNEKLLNSLNQQIQDEIYLTLIKQVYWLEEEINKQNEEKMNLLEKHDTLKKRLLALQMIEINLDEITWFQSDQRNWLDVQLRVAKQELTACKLADIHLLDITIIGLYTQLDHTRHLLQCGKP